MCDGSRRVGLPSLVGARAARVPPSSAARVWTVELVRDRQTKEPLVPIGATGRGERTKPAFVEACLARGLVPLVLGNRIQLSSPPLDVNAMLSVATGHSRSWTRLWLRPTRSWPDESEASGREGAVHRPIRVGCATRPDRGSSRHGSAAAVCLQRSDEQGSAVGRRHARMRSF